MKRKRAGQRWAICVSCCFFPFGFSGFRFLFCFLGFFFFKKKKNSFLCLFFLFGAFFVALIGGRLDDVFFVWGG